MHAYMQALDVNEPVSRMITHYDEYYKYSIEHPKEFWGEMAARTLVWDEPFDRDKVMEGCDMNEGKISFFDGKLNASGIMYYNVFSYNITVSLRVNFHNIIIV